MLRILRRPDRSRWRAALRAAVVVAGATLVAAVPAAADGPVVIETVTIDPHVWPAAAEPDGTIFGCQSGPLDDSFGARCYQPAQLQEAYGLAPLLKAGFNGAGRTIVVIDAFGSPTIETDVRVFDQRVELPDPSLIQVTPLGAPPAFDPNDSGQVDWAIETALDVEYAHAMAPGAQILLAVSPSALLDDLVRTMEFVIGQNLGDVISMSFGVTEQCMDPTLRTKMHTAFAAATRKGITLLASSGDSGAARASCDGSGPVRAVSAVAADPRVTGVGGTTLDADTVTGAYRSETAWTEPFGCNPPAVAADDVNCSGGGFSVIYDRPSYQAGVIGRQGGRGVPDVAYNAGSSGGVLFHCGVCNVLFVGEPADAPRLFIIGGTSAGVPQWAGLIAVGDQLGRHRMGNVNPALYTLSRAEPIYHRTLHDIATGNNRVVEIGGDGYDAGKGWDPVTGLGTPNAVVLLPLLARLTRRAG